MKQLIIAILTFSLFTTACNTKNGSGHLKEKKLQDSSAKAAKLSLNIDSLMDKSFSERNTARVWAKTEAVMLNVDSTENTESYTQKMVSQLIWAVERKVAYHFDTLDINPPMHYKALSLAVLNSKEGHFKITLWRNMKNQLIFIRVSKLSVTKNGFVSEDDLALDSNGDGFLRPKGGDDYAVWPSPVKSSWEFSKLPAGQLEYANEKYLQTVRFLRDCLL